MPADLWTNSNRTDYLKPYIMNKHDFEFRFTPDDKAAVLPYDLNDCLKDFKFDFKALIPNPQIKRVSQEARLLRKRWISYLNRWQADAARWRRVRAIRQRRNEPVEDRWTLNMDLLPEALDFLGINWEVQVCQHAQVGLGAHHGALGESDFDPNLVRVTDPIHVLGIEPGLAPTAASICLWHELTHAKQAEAHNSPWAFYLSIRDENRAAIPGSLEYFDLWFEREAFKNMDLHFEIGPLAVPA